MREREREEREEKRISDSDVRELGLLDDRNKRVEAS
jgi:hypothetical protein